MIETTHDPPHDKNHGLSRRTHRKSRAGCIECKRRRIKCDEVKPSCGNCVRRTVTCRFRSNAPATRSEDASAATTPSQHTDPTIVQLSFDSTISTPTAHLIPSTASTPPIPSAAGVEIPNLFHLELWHHWLTTACLTFSDDDNRVGMWRETVPQLAVRHSYVAQLLLALSALHLARLQTVRRALCMATSTALQSSAIDGMIDGLAASPDSDRTSSLFIAATLLCFCNLAKGPQDGQYLLYADTAEPEWLGLLQGVKSILAEHRHVLADLSDEDGRAGDVEESVGPDLALSGFSASFDKLKTSIESLRAEDESFAKYSRPVDDLQKCFDSAFWRQQGSDVIRVHSPAVFGWLYRLNAEYLKALQDGKPMALVIYAYYMVLFARLDRFWFVEGWVDHIMVDIQRRLHHTYKHWMEWPCLLAQPAESQSAGG
ncbi:uncharacterized protein MYCGRDRAFT_77156 [Zymoseptoria tritici IPO323]|uniref:Zn(2)-C6 fungal-type domain-containing protein n=2 Tax=Zymoseptoria tritici TaxID=1047171 RepID=F9XPC3_ZYMTI|nr:uncharacterized protein MYCGRDRAFT_77156 [Zymoseptoria tritici IPO323]EGP83227.1 hypothetical protein MYCGRDRAFT_77156 [Zymoseptoria tritici IPO323]